VSGRRSHRIGFQLLDGFSMIAINTLVELLQAAPGACAPACCAMPN